MSYPNQQHTDLPAAQQPQPQPQPDLRVARFDPPQVGGQPQPLQMVPTTQYGEQAPTGHPAEQPAADEVGARLPEGRILTEQETADGWVIVRLSTPRGEADIAVPPQDDWLSTARNAAFSRGDDLMWAQQTLSPDDAMRWAELNPTARQSQAFFEAWGRTQGNRAQRRAQGLR